MWCCQIPQCFIDKLSFLPFVQEVAALKSHFHFFPGRLDLAQVNYTYIFRIISDDCACLRLNLTVYPVVGHLGLISPCTRRGFQFSPRYPPPSSSFIFSSKEGISAPIDSTPQSLKLRPNLSTKFQRRYGTNLVQGDCPTMLQRGSAPAWKEIPTGQSNS